MESQTLDEWFNPTDASHIAAFKHLENFGTWPDGFIPDHIIITQHWYTNIIYQMAQCWLYNSTN
jgi:hypothetical protein